MRSIKILLIIFLLCILIAIGIVVYEIREEISESESETSSEAYDSTANTIIKPSTSAQKNPDPSTQQNQNQTTAIVAPGVVTINPRSYMVNKPSNDNMAPTALTTSKVGVSNRCTVDSTSSLGNVSTKENQGNIHDLDSKKSKEQTQSTQSSVNLEKDDLAKKAAAPTKSTASGSRLYPRLEDDINDERVSIDSSPKYTESTTVYAHKPTQLSAEPVTSHAALDLDGQQTTSLSRGIDAVSSITKEKEKEEQKDSRSSPELKQENGLKQTARINEEEEEEEEEKHLESNTSSFDIIDPVNESMPINTEGVIAAITPPAADQRSNSTSAIPVKEEKSNASSFDIIDSNDESRSIEEIKAVSTITPPAAGQSSGSTPAILVEEEVKNEEHLEGIEKSFEMIGSNLDGDTAEEKELVSMLNAIAKLNPDLPKVNYSNDTEIINAIIKNKDVVVIKKQDDFDINKSFLQITLWEVLNGVANGETSHKYSSMRTTRITFIISYPKELQQNPIIEHALLRYYGNLPISTSSLTLEGFEFAANASIFNKYGIFDKISTLILAETRICSSTLAQLGECSDIIRLNICKNTVIDFDSKLDLGSSKIFIVEIDGIDRKYIDPLLIGLDAMNGMSEISISNIDFMSTSTLNSLKFSKVFEFTLKNIVFDGSPDFSFLRKMDCLFTLTMNNIFYSYTNEFKIEDLDRIKQNPEEYLRITAEPEDSSAQKQIELNKSDDIVKKNKAVGGSISPKLVNVDSKLYNDLGLCKLKSKEGNNSCYMNIQLAPKSLDGTMPTKFRFSLVKTRINVCLYSDDSEIQDVIDCLKCIDFPFTLETVIDEIKLNSSLMASNNSEIMEMISDRLFKYAEHNKIKKITVFSIFTSTPMDMYRVVMFNSKMPTLEEMTLSNIKLTPTKASAQNDDEKKALKSYCTFIEKDSSYKELHIVKNGNIMKIEQKPKK
ncbi:uncharacterized protein NEPG_02214 [Nematocida parisii ERTm1]|uniref:uncharacterized protein n=1 Tax=Nematocida parisii (strain ERTm1 / ATCC PRA-289) TaxID=881290 RepID=UPI000264BA95|nr:uncharacterized protein NEPG_02214 [Nematocida parisii ERTm1]EIJ92815.1 hypothetical protein NEPG_02214 [Nematocida parisii ERTm1]|eukprot:XP_013060041.1 hypothetical protein NEPG_02214 [Nematocida parisii ERTm1]